MAEFLPGEMAFAGEGGVAADDEALAKVVGTFDFGEVALVK